MSTEILKVEGLRAGYGDADILHGIDLAIAEGDFISVIGPNGAGKSTLLKALHGVLAPRAGSVWLSSNGTAVDVAGSKPYRVTGLGMNYVPQLANVFPRLTLAENLEIGGTVVRREMKRHLDRVYRMFPLLYNRRKERAGVLSGGQRQMLALARALMTEPRVLLLDEPSAGLAPMMVDEVFGKLAEISGSGVAILMVEQNARRSLAASRYTYVLDMGTNRYQGESQKLMHDPEIVALYLGGAGRLDASVEETGGGVR